MQPTSGPPVNPGEHPRTTPATPPPQLESVHRDPGVRAWAYGPGMATRPSARWRARVESEATELAAGTRAPSDAFLSDLFPESLLAATDGALQAFESEVDPLRNQDDEQVFEVIKRVVLALNEINEDHDGAGFETEEREELCLYIDQVLTGHGIDVPALAARRGISRTEITDDWRDW